MENRNLDLGVPLREDEWDRVRRTAQAIHSLGYDWEAKDPERIRLRLRTQDAEGLLAERLVPLRDYGPHEMELAQFVYNDGRPYAHLENFDDARPPAKRPEEIEALEREQTVLVRQRWHELLNRSGIPFDTEPFDTDIT